jgi:hypothetical protein
MFGRHLFRRHGLGIVEYRLETRHHGDWPTCACGCGQDVNYSSVRAGFSKVLFGHRSTRMDRRSRGFWRSPETLERRLEMRKLSAVSGKRRWHEMKPIDYKHWRQGVSRGLHRRYLKGGNYWAVGRYNSTKTGRTVMYRSSWELRHMVSLDVDVAVREWHYEPIGIDYRYEGEVRTYIPDFLVVFVDGRMEMHEVGSWREKVKPQAQAKHRALVRWCQKRGIAARLVCFDRPPRSSMPTKVRRLA